MHQQTVEKRNHTAFCRNDSPVIHVAVSWVEPKAYRVYRRTVDFPIRMLVQYGRHNGERTVADDLYPAPGHHAQIMDQGSPADLAVVFLPELTDDIFFGKLLVIKKKKYRFYRTFMHDLFGGAKPVGIPKAKSLLFVIFTHTKMDCRKRAVRIFFV